MPYSLVAFVLVVVFSEATSKVLARFSLELEMEDWSEKKEGDGRLGGFGEIGDEVYMDWRELSSAGGVSGSRESVRNGERGAIIADRWGEALSKSFQLGSEYPWSSVLFFGFESLVGEGSAFGGGYIGR